jgi:glycine oxidase
MAEPQPPIAVIGAGITGAFCAYLLARRGRSTVLIERDGVAAHASGTNAGGLNPLHGPGIPGPLDGFALRALQLHLAHWPVLAELSGAAFGARRVPRLHLARAPDEVAALRERGRLHDRTPGFSAQWLDGEATRAAVPAVRGPIAGGLWSEGNARVEPAAYVSALVEAACRLGARLLTAEATALEHERGRVTAIRLGRERLVCAGAVLATGPWCREPGRWLSLRLPVGPVRGELVRVAPGVALDAEVTFGTTGVYEAATAGERWLGGTADHVGLRSTPTAAGRRRITAAVAALLPDVAAAPALEQRAALRPVTEDGLPIIGPAPGWQNVVLALGGGSKGMLLGAAMAAAAADALLGPTADPDLTLGLPEATLRGLTLGGRGGERRGGR